MKKSKKVNFILSEQFLTEVAQIVWADFGQNYEAIRTRLLNVYNSSARNRVNITPKARKELYDLMTQESCILKKTANGVVLDGERLKKFLSSLSPSTPPKKLVEEVKEAAVVVEQKPTPPETFGEFYSAVCKYLSDFSEFNMKTVEESISKVLLKTADPEWISNRVKYLLDSGILVNFDGEMLLESKWEEIINQSKARNRQMTVPVPNPHPQQVHVVIPPQKPVIAAVKPVVDVKPVVASVEVVKQEAQVVQVRLLNYVRDKFDVKSIIYTDSEMSVVLIELTQDNLRRFSTLKRNQIFLAESDKDIFKKKMLVYASGMVSDLKKEVSEITSEIHKLEKRKSEKEQALEILEPWTL